MCHKNAEQILKLINKCSTTNSDVIIHADNKMNIKEYNKIKDFVKDKPNVYLTKERIHGELDTRSLVDIVFIMLKEIKKRNLSYKYYCLLSGQDYPIKSINWINEELQKNYPKPFIDCTPYSNSNWIYYKFNNADIIYKLNNFISTNFKSGSIIRKILRLAALILSKILKVLKKTQYYELTKLNISLYGGSAWWILPDIAIDYIYNEYINNTFIVNKLLKTYTPEETFFQIMAMRSPIKEQIEINPKNMIEQNSKTWAYFSDKDKPFKGHPYIFTKHEFKKIKASKAWFARKFDITVDKEIFDLIDKHISN